MEVYFYLILFASTFVQSQLSKTTIKLGALYQEGTEVARRAVKLVVEELNSENRLFRFVIHERNISYDDSMDGLVQTCDLADLGVTSLISVVNGLMDLTLQSVSNNLHLPLLQVGETRYLQTTNPYLYSPKPDKNHLLKALIYYVRKMKINSFIIVYDDYTAASAAQDFTHQLYETNSEQVNFYSNFVVKIETNKSDGLMNHSMQHVIDDMMNILRRSHLVQLETIVVFTRFSNIWNLINKIYEEKHMQSKWLHWILVKPDLPNSDLKRLQQLDFCTITVITQFLNLTNPLVKKFTLNWNKQLKQECRNCPTPNLIPSDIPLQAYYIMDGVRHLAVILKRLEAEGVYFAPTSLKCGSPARWRGGKQIMQHIKQINTSGILSDIGLNKKGYNELGTIEIKTKPTGKKNKFIREAPFVFETTNGTNFSGFSIELFQKIAQKHGFRYKIYKVPDGKFGSNLKNNTWNGMIGELIRGHAQIAVAALTITADREKVVDFAKRYMDYSVGIALKRPIYSSSIFSFVEPFHTSVWFCIGLCLMLVVVFIYSLQQISPKEPVLHNPRNHSEERFSFGSVFWYTYSSLMQQGSELRLTSLPARVVTGFWWLFTLVIVSSYTANLAAFLTVQRMELPIRSFTDLVKQQDLDYGTVPDTSIFDYIMAKGKETQDNNSQFKKMAHVINTTRNKMSKPDEGFQRASADGFAFLWDVAVIEYEVLKHNQCALTMVGDSIYDKGYGFALQHGSPYRDLFSHAILDLQENGEIERLREKYWPKSGRCGLNEGRRTKANKRTLENFTGTFFVLAAGMVLACVIALVEMLMHKSKKKAPLGKSTPETDNYVKNSAECQEDPPESNPEEVTFPPREKISIVSGNAPNPSRTSNQTYRESNAINKDKCHSSIKILKMHHKKTKQGHNKKAKPNSKAQGIKEVENFSRNQIEDKEFLRSFGRHSACYNAAGTPDSPNALQYGLLKCSPRRRLINGYATVPRINYSFSSEDPIPPPPLQYCTMPLNNEEKLRQEEKLCSDLFLSLNHSKKLLEQQQTNFSRNQTCTTTCPNRPDKHLRSESPSNMPHCEKKSTV